MRIIFVLFLITLANCDVEACIKDKCKKQYDGCVASIFSCAVHAQQCKSKCSTDPACMKQCVADKKDKKLTELYNCAAEFCADALDFPLPEITPCPVAECLTTFNLECEMNESANCASEFLLKNPHCSCLEQL